MAESLQLVLDVLRDLSRERVIPADIADMPLSAATEIDDLGIDSIGKLNLLSELEDRADLALSESSLSGKRTLGDLAAVLAELKR
jgi:acyl carrier protein